MNPQTPIFYVTGGTLRHDAPSYVERGADRELFDGLLRGEFCYVLTSRQMGKSSLMVRTASTLREQGVVVVVLDLTAVGQNVTPEQWYHGLLMGVGRQLWAEDELERFWDAHPKLSPVQRFFSALRDVILGKKHGASRILKPDGRVVIFVDEIDVVRSLPFRTDEFFAAIRECYNRRTEDREFERVTFCLLGVATPSDLITDTRITPFNIGRRIELHDFTPAEAAPLAAWLDPRLALTESRILLERVLYWTNGHPYLTQRLCQAVAESSTATNEANRGATSRVDIICAQLFFTADARENDDNLIFVRERLLRSDEVDRVSLLALYGQMVARKTVHGDRTNPLISILYLSGVARPDAGRLVPRNRIYERVFDHNWIDANLPEADVRRQREAFRRGVIRTTAIAAVIVIAMTVLAVIAANQARNARTSLAEANFSQAKARRVSGISGQRHASLPALQKARSDYTNQAALRDEAIASLALVDLKDTDIPFPESGGAFAVNPGISAIAQTNGAITVHNTRDRKLLKTLPPTGLPLEQLWTARGGTVLAAQYCGAAEHDLIVWDWAKGQRLFAVTGTTHGIIIDFSADARRLAVGQPDGKLAVYSVPEGENLLEWELRLESGLPRTPQAIRFSPRGNFIAESSLDDLNVGVWDLETGEKTPLFHAAPVYDISWHPTRELLATACGDSAVYLWNLKTERSKKLGGHESGVTAVAFNHRGTLIATAGLDETVRLWVPATERPLTHRLEAQTFSQLQFSDNDDLLLATGSRQTAPRFWDVLADDHLVIHDAAMRVEGIDFSPDGNLVTTVGLERATLWACDSGRELSTIHMTNAHTAMFSADSRSLIVSTAKGLFDYSIEGSTAGKRHQFELKLKMRSTNSTENDLGPMGLSRDRATAAVVHLEEILLCRFPSDTNVMVRRIPVGTHYHSLSFHPDGLWVAAAVKQSNSIDIWNVSDSRNDWDGRALTLPSSEYFTFSREWLVTCWAGKFHFYRVGAWQEPAFSRTRDRTSIRHAPIAFTTNGEIVALASSVYAIQLFRVPKGDGADLQLIATLEAPDRSPLEILAFNPDGTRLAAATQNGALHLWNLSAVRRGLAALKLESGWPKISTND